MILRTLPILTLPHPHLRLRAREVDSSYTNTEEFKKFARVLGHTMHKKEGVGLAATQVNLQKRIICVHYEAVPADVRPLFTLKKNEDLILLNPEWFPLNQKKQWGAEGCLSVPGKFGEVERFIEIQAHALTAEGAPVQFKAANFFARVLQHEVDHLNGVLFIDKAHNVQNTAKNAL